MNNELVNKFKNIKDKKKIFFIICVSLSLFVVMSFINHNDTETTDENITQNSIELSQIDIQKNLESIISRINGVGNVHVMITYESSGEYVYAVNLKSENNGDRTSEDSEIVLYESPHGNDEGLLVSFKNPEISGVAIICDGGKNLKIKSEITELVTRLFGIGADRVFVGTSS